MANVIVIGIDGCTFNLLKPLADRGKIPTLERIMKEGCKGYLESCIPVSSIPAWQCYSTGREPSKLGFYGFFKVKIINNKIEVRPVSSHDVEGKEIWDYLGKFNYKSCVIDMPGTYPARKINGVMLSNPIAGDDWIYPKSLKKDVMQLGYRDPAFLDKGTRRYFEDLMDVIQSRFKVADHLLRKERPDFLHLTIFYIEVVHHNAWGNMDLISEFYEMIDNGIRDIVEVAETINEDVTIFVMSDHGHTKLKDIFYINEFLRLRGYLRVKSLLLPKIMAKLGINIKSLYKISNRFGLLDIVRKIIPNKVKELVPDQRGHLPGYREITERIRPDSIAFSLDGLQIYMFTNDDEMRERLIKDLESVKHPSTGEKVIKAYKREQIYKSYDKETPHVLINPCEGYWTSREITNGKLWEKVPDSRWAGTHSIKGIFIAYGKHVKKNDLNVKIYDLAPTILHIFGIPIPKDVDGRVLKEIFKDESEYAKREPVYMDYEKSKIKEKIRELKLKKRI